MTRIIIEHDETAESPREWDNLGVMAAFHGHWVSPVSCVAIIHN
jgi:hypothetical protein